MKKIIPNYFPRPPAPVTDEDFRDEMFREAFKDLLIQGYHMAPNGMELFVEDVPMTVTSISDLLDDKD